MAIVLPASSATVDVRIIDTATVHMSTKIFLTPSIESHADMNCPAFSFLVTDATGKRHVLFDLGIDKAYRDNFPPHAVERLDRIGARLVTPNDVADVLDGEGAQGDASLPKAKDIESIIWSHHHFDHTGDPNRFPSSTSLVVGPGFKEAVFPGYPDNSTSLISSALWADREMVELDFTDPAHALTIGQFDAYDYFSDGSFYLLSTPGHAPGHLSGLARVTPTTFVLMGGDVAHHSGQLRPSSLRPLPDRLAMPSSVSFQENGCPCALLAALQPGPKGEKEPFYEPTDHACEVSKEQAMLSQRGISALDGSDDVFIILAHDRFARHGVPKFPHSLRGWKADDLANKLRWSFVDDFAASVDKLHVK